MSEGYNTQYSQPEPQPAYQPGYPNNNSSITPGQPEPQTAAAQVALPGTYLPPTGPPPPPPPQGPGFPTSPTSPAAPGAPHPFAGGQQRPGSPYQPGYPQQQHFAPPPSIVYNGILVPNPEAPAAPHGTLKVAGYLPEKDFEVLKGAKKGLLGGGWNEATLTKLLTKLSPFETDALSDYFVARTGKTLVEYLPEKTKLNGWFYEVIHALALGPLGYDVELARRATKGVGTKEDVLIELLLNRTNEDIEALKRAYTRRWGSSLVQEVKDDVSGSSKAMFNMALMGQRPVELPGHVNYGQVEKDVDDLNQHGLGRNTAFDEVFFCQVFINRSDAHIAAVIDRYSQKYKSLSKVIKSTVNFSADVRKGLLYIIHGVKSKRNRQEPYGAWRDAKLVEKAMAGMGTNDEALVYRVVRASWNPTRMKGIRDAFLQRYGKTMERRVQKETSGSYKTILTELINRG